MKMTIRKAIGLAASLGAIASSAAAADMVSQPPVPNDSGELLPTHEVIAHDPVLIRQDGVYYLFTTGPGVTIWKSKDMDLWERAGRVFPDRPEWADETVPGFNGHLWAPDISYNDGRYYLYYSVSAFGKNTSAMGLATNSTLHSEDADYEWIDHGIVLQSYPGLDNWNAIDPNLVFDDDGTPYLAWGSFWGGLMLAQLSPDLTTIVDDREDFVLIASRNPGPSERPAAGFSTEAGPGAIEGPFIIKRGDYFYQFASVDYCCRGRDSTYRMIVGRSASLKGPYVDAEGMLLNEGGGTELLAGDDRWHGTGHNGVFEFDGVDYLVFHGYDGLTERGLPKLRIKKLTWNPDGWPEVKL